MPWYWYLAHFFAGAFFVNAIPHFVQGVSGRSFPSPFSKPPGKGKSSPVVNVLWGALNAVIGYALLRYVGVFHIRYALDVCVVAVGGLVMAILLAQSFGQIYSRE